MKRSYGSKFFVVCLLNLFFSTAHGQDSKLGKLLSTYQIKVSAGESFSSIQSSHYQMGVLTTSKGKILIVAKDYPAQSITSAKARAHEDGASPGEVKILKWKDRALFYYETNQEIHVYSTLGGHLSIAKSSKRKFDVSKLSLVTKVTKKVAKL